MAAELPSQSLSSAYNTATPEHEAAKHIGLAVAVLALLVVVLMPTPVGLSQPGQVMLGILAFAVIVWMTEALD